MADWEGNRRDGDGEGLAPHGGRGQCPRLGATSRWRRGARTDTKCRIGGRAAFAAKVFPLWGNFLCLVKVDKVIHRTVVKKRLNKKVKNRLEGCGKLVFCH